jgi:hypothetical protein
MESPPSSIGQAKNQQGRLAKLRDVHLLRLRWCVYILRSLVTPSNIFQGNRIESCLGYNEKSFLVFQKLKEAKKNPVFTFKHINDISSPIAVAQQKHAARKANTPKDSASTPSSSTQDNKTSQSGRTISRPSTDENVPRTSPPVGENEGSARGAAQAREMLPPTAQGISYAVAIYSYMAE